jgi:uncharacterized protein YeaO (DUF488 family)
MIRVKRIYESRERGPEDGKRVLIDRLWPRGLRKDEVVFDEWLKDIAPSNELRRWFAHDPARWEEFRRRYRDELKEKEGLLDKLRQDGDRENLTLLFSAKDPAHNNAVVLRDLLSSKYSTLENGKRRNG